MLNSIAGVSAIFLTSLIGVICSIVSLYIIYKAPLLKNAFGRICAIHSICEAGVLATFVFWVAPVTLIHSIKAESLLGVTIGSINTLCYFGSIFFQFSKSLNRLIAIVFPIYYRTIFDIEHQKKFIISITILTIIFAVPSFFYECNYIFVPDFFYWAPRNESCNDLTFYFDVIGGAGTQALSVIFDATTLIYIRLTHKKLQKNTTLKRDIRFFFQSCLTSALYCVPMISAYGFIKLTENEIIIFILSNMTFILCRTMNEIFFILFNYRLTVIRTTQIHHTSHNRSVTFEPQRRLTF